MAHLTHNLPWSTLTAAIKCDPDWRQRHKNERKEFDKKVAHFIGALSSAIEEFTITDKRPDEKKEYDVFEWALDDSYAVYRINFLVGFVGSVVNAYVMLSLLVVDEARMRPALYERRIWILNEPAGFGDDGHPEKFADMLLPLLDRSHVTEFGRYSKFEIKKLTPDVIDGVRKYCAELFKVMYTRPGVFTRERIELDLTWQFNLLYKTIG